MIDSEGELEVLLDIFSPSPTVLKDLLREDMSGEALEFTDDHGNSELRGVLACPEVTSLQSIQLELQFFLSRADDLHDCLVSGLLYTCQPYFNHLESTGRSTDLVYDLLTIHAPLCAPPSTSHFCIGQIQLGGMKLTTFRYCKPTPYLSHADTGVYKRMRWNVERLQKEQQRGDDNIPGRNQPIISGLPENASCYLAVCLCFRILCEVPEGSYHRLLFLGPEEPSSCMATDYVQQLLLSCHTD
ncbi:hypothetical protein GOODEAATRI_005212 [Goodea atripinnis]|uniref:Uncharacterized protein n=1 Tax=Goodea atripinnis TaxID=208336 RepID=A0ABV0MH66_9TELE